MKSRLLKKMAPLTVLTVLVSSGLQAASFEAYRPTWKIGQKWTVEIAVKSQPKSLAIPNPPPFVAQWGILTCGFEVEKVVEIEGDLCWCVRIDYLKEKKGSPDPVSLFRMYYRITDSTLKHTESVNNRTGGFIASETYSGGSAVIDLWAGPVPMAFPFLLANSEKFSPKPEIRKDGTKRYKSYEAYQTCHIIEKIVEGEKKKVLSVYIKEKNEVKDQEGLAAVQLWEKGMPWWSESTETENGNFRCKARLISIDGRKLENPAPWNLGSANSQ